MAKVVFKDFTKSKSNKVSKPKRGRAKSGELRASQKRILLFLSKFKGEANYKLICEKAKCDLTSSTPIMGSQDNDRREFNDTKPGGFPSLISLGFVKAFDSELERGTCYTITAAGRKAVEKLTKNK